MKKRIADFFGPTPLDCIKNPDGSTSYAMRDEPLPKITAPDEQLHGRQMLRQMQRDSDSVVQANVEAVDSALDCLANEIAYYTDELSKKHSRGGKISGKKKSDLATYDDVLMMARKDVEECHLSGRGICRKGWKSRILKTLGSSDWRTVEKRLAEAGKSEADLIAYMRSLPQGANSTAKPISSPSKR
jgi:hypothetical protein